MPVRSPIRGTLLFFLVQFMCSFFVVLVSACR
uniref:Uncharacterized protein n=1 Tax=Triticum urartu TaxID=4572 RepID=A0A8R7UGE3_TRIUA